jgi:hypothetical protein
MLHDSDQKHWWRLHPEMGLRGVGCDGEGPRIGPVPLLQRQSSGWEPRPASELSRILRAASYPIDLATRASGLAAAARAMNEGDLARAILCTLHMRLLPLHDNSAAMNAMRSDWLRKDGGDRNRDDEFDELHPRQDAGTVGPDGKTIGGQFKSKNDALETDTPKTDVPKTVLPKAGGAEGGGEGTPKGGGGNETLVATSRQAARAVLINALDRWQENIERVASHHFGMEFGIEHDIQQKIHQLKDYLLLDDLSLMAVAVKEMPVDFEAAKKFAEGGPRTLEEVRVSDKSMGFSSFYAFKKGEDDITIDLEKIFESAGPGNDWDHNVEQTMNRGKFPPQQIHSTENIIRLPKLFHEAKSGLYSSIQNYSKPYTVRQWLNSQTFEEQYDFGIGVYTNLGILKKSRIGNYARWQRRRTR